MFVKFLGKDNEQLTGEVIQTRSRLKKLVKKMQKIKEFAFDTETNTLRVQWKGEVKLVGISICWGKYNTYYIPVGHFFDEKDQLPAELVIDMLRPIFEREDIRIIGHNLKFDRHVLADFDINFSTKDLFDTMIASWIIDENEQKGLKHLTDIIYNIPQGHFDECLKTVTTEEKKAYGLKGSSKPPFQLVRISVGAPYAMADAYWTWRHYVDWTQDLIEKEDMSSIFYKKMMPFSDTLYKMERRGANVDEKMLERMKIKAEKDLADLEYQIIEIAGVKFNVGSGQQIAELLFGYKKFNNKGEFTGNIDIINKNFGYPVIATTKGGAPATGEKDLKPLLRMTFKKDKRKQEGQKMLRLLLKFKKLNKLKTAFIDGLLSQRYEDGKVHPTFNLGGASSGRLSCIAEGTPIKCIGKDKPIEDIVVGDMVYCYDNKGNLHLRKVTKVMDNGIRPCVRVTWRSSGSHDYGTLVCTPDHRIRLANGKWKEAQHLSKNDKLTYLRRSTSIMPRLYGLNGICEQEQVFIEREISKCNDPNTIKRLDLCYNHQFIKAVPCGKRHVYDLEVEEYHNFIASEICVHNCSEPNLQQLPRPVEMSDPLLLKDWMKKNDIHADELSVKRAEKQLEHLVKKGGYVTGKIKCKLPSKLTKQYCEYLKEWRVKNEENIFWKFYEIRQAFIPDNPEKESLIAIDYANLEMRLLAHFSEDPYLVETFKEEHDKVCACRV